MTTKISRRLRIMYHLAVPQLYSVSQTSSSTAKAAMGTVSANESSILQGSTMRILFATEWCRASSHNAASTVLHGISVTKHSFTGTSKHRAELFTEMTLLQQKHSSASSFRLSGTVHGQRDVCVVTLTATNEMRVNSSRRASSKNAHSYSQMFTSKVATRPKCTDFEEK